MKADEILIIDGLSSFDAQHERKATGAIIVEGMHVADTLRCVHCGHVWIPIKGSGRKRGYCTKCNGVTCGAHKCDTCYPFEKQLEDYEKGKLNVLK
jgi:hypothetical protein